jgi:nucleotide-binding universal stress UspA family protein
MYETLVSDSRLGLADLRRRFEDHSRERLASAVADAVGTSSATVETTLGVGKPYREILRVADEQQADLIVMGVHGRGPADLMFFGSTTNHVVRQARCPVLTVRK